MRANIELVGSLTLHTPHGELTKNAPQVHTDPQAIAYFQTQGGVTVTPMAPPERQKAVAPKQAPAAPSRGRRAAPEPTEPDAA